MLFCSSASVPSSIRCLDSCTVDESAGVIHIEVTVDLDFSSVASKRRRRRNSYDFTYTGMILERFSTAGPRGRGREWATLGVHPLSWLLSNNRLEELSGTLTTGTFSSRLLLSNQDKGCTPSVAHSLPLPLGSALLNLWTAIVAQVALLSYLKACNY